MKKLNIYYTIFLLSSFSLVSCELDNYSAPDSVIYGSIYDIADTTLVRQDIINGAQIEYVEHGYTNPTTQYQIIKNDGTYRNNLMFSNTYTMQLVRGNFVPLDKIEKKVKGDTKIDFFVQPYIRVKNAQIVKAGNIVTATFNLQQTVPNNVSKVGLYVHEDPTVGYNCYIIPPIEKTIDAVTSENVLYTIQLDVSSYKDVLISGKQYYFIIGALIDATSAQAKPNYAIPVRITI